MNYTTKHKRLKSVIIWMIFVIIFCASCENSGQQDYLNLPRYSDNGYLNAVIEIPAGTNHKIEFNKKSLRFEVDKRDNKERVINFLPYPGNYGYVPSTLSDTNEGGDGDAIDVLVLSESVPTGTILEVVPVGVLKLIDNEEKDYKIIAVPANLEQRTLNVTNFEELETKYPNAMKIIETWFLNYDKQEPAYIQGWGDEIEAIKEINGD